MRRFLKWARRLSAAPPALARRVPTARPTLESLEERTVPALIPVAANAGYPFTSICQVNIWFPNGARAQGSGAMLDQEHVLTAGHCVYDSRYGGWASKIEVVPEASPGSAPFGDAWMTQERTYTTWINYSNGHPGKTAAGDMDIGLLTLDRNIGFRTGWMGFAVAKSLAYNLNTAGYPGASGYNGQSMYRDSAVGVFAGSSFVYGHKLIPGQSGSPVWTYNSSNQQRYIRGVLVGASGLGTAVTSKIFNDFENLMAADETPVSTATAGTSTASASSLSSSGLADHAGAPALGDGLAGGILADAATDGSGNLTPAAADAAFAAASVAGSAQEAATPAPTISVDFAKLAGTMSARDSTGANDLLPAVLSDPLG